MSSPAKTKTPAFFLKDSLSGAPKALSLPQGSDVSIYACGITPYSPSHVGHARSYAAFDLLERTLSALGYRPRLARNITDIDDKIIAAAKSQGIHWSELSGRHAAKNRQLMERAGIRIPLEPKASEHIPQILDLIGALLSLGLAYAAPNGDILYRVAAHAGERLLARHEKGSSLSEAGEGRVSAQGKEDSRDFALWKRFPSEEPGFPSPFGYGRPGWHIECSAMIGALFGGSVDIHGGGSDLKFPHHQAEILQSEPVFGKPLASIWAHNGSVLSDGKKMSKSLGNYVEWSAALDMAEAALPGSGGDLLRFSLLSAHWQKPLDWSERLLSRAAEDLALLGEAARSRPSDPAALERAKALLLGDLAANLNFPQALERARRESKANGSFALALGDLLGMDPSSWRKPLASRDPALAEALRREREQARADRDWSKADALREALLALGETVSDRPAAKSGPQN